MRQRYAYGSNIAAVRCGWENRISEQWRIKDCNLQSAAVLWLRHSFARAFSEDSALFSFLVLWGQGWVVMLSVAKHLVIASEQRERGNQQARNPNMVDCHEANASRNDRWRDS